MSEKSAKKLKPPHLFQPGQSGNPKGKPPGTRSKITVAALVLLEGEAQALTRRAIDAALGGDMMALRLCLERIIPPAKDRPIKTTLPVAETAQDLPKLTAALLAATANGDIGASEAATLSRMVEAHGKALELADLDTRLQKIEEALENEK